MFCKYCGKEIPDDATFCPACGKELGSPGKVAETEKTDAAEPAAPKTEVKRRGWIVAIVIIVAAAVVALIAVFAFSGRGGSDVSSDTSTGIIKSQPELSAHNVEVAQEVIDTVDQYLNGDITTAAVAARNVQSLITHLEMPDSSDDAYQLTLEVKDCMYNIQVELENLRVVSGFIDYAAGNDPELGSRQQLMEYREDLAKTAGLD